MEGVDLIVQTKNQNKTLKHLPTPGTPKKIISRHHLKKKKQSQKQNRISEERGIPSNVRALWFF